MMPRVLLSTFFALLLTALVPPVSADEFDTLRDALKRAWEPFTHYTAEVRVTTYQSNKDDPALRLISEATRVIEIQQVKDPKGHKRWHQERNEEWRVMDQQSQAREYRREELAIRPVAYGIALLVEVRKPDGEVTSTGYLGDYNDVSLYYPHAIMNLTFVSLWTPPDLSYSFSQPTEDYQGLPGMRMTLRAIDVTLWFSPEHDLFPIRSLKISKTPDRGTYRFIHTVQEFGTAEYKGRSVYYPKKYTHENFGPDTGRCYLRYVMDVRSFQFHEFDPDFHPTVTFPRGLHVVKREGQESRIEYRTFVRETHPGGYWNSYTIAKVGAYCILIALVPGVWLVIKLVEKRRSK